MRISLGTLLIAVLASGALLGALVIQSKCSALREENRLLGLELKHLDGYGDGQVWACSERFLSFDLYHWHVYLPARTTCRFVIQNYKFGVNDPYDPSLPAFASVDIAPGEFDVNVRIDSNSEGHKELTVFSRARNFSVRFDLSEYENPGYLSDYQTGSAAEPHKNYRSEDPLPVPPGSGIELLRMYRCDVESPARPFPPDKQGMRIWMVPERTAPKEQRHEPH
jgi:hypothetical protein